MAQDPTVGKRSGVRQSFLLTNTHTPTRPDSQPDLYGLGDTPAEGQMQDLQ